MRLTDLDDLMAALTSAGVYPDAKTSDIIANAPTVDAELVTRCVDCAHCVNPYTKGTVYCDHWGRQVTTKSSYCSNAIRRGDEKKC